MISLDDYTDHDGLGLAELVATKQVTARELFETAIAAIERINPQINAVCRTLPGDAEKAMSAGLPSGPFTGVAVEFVEARSVRDVAAVLDAVAGADPGAPGIGPRPPQQFAALAAKPPGRLRIAWTSRSASGAEADPECVAAVQAAARVLEDLGHDVVEDAPRFEWEAFLDNVHVIWTACTAAFADALAQATGRKVGPDTLEAATLACYEDGKRYSALDLINAMNHGGLLSRQVAAFFQNIDVMVTPTVGRPPPRLGEIDQDRSGITAQEWTREVFAYCPFTPLYNTTGQQAISLPLHTTASGLPVGVQFAARMGEEATLLQLASQIEAARPWRSRKPPIFAAG